MPMGGFLSSVFDRRTADSRGATARATGNTYKAMWTQTGPIGPWDIERSIKDGMEKVIRVFKCVDVIASNQASLPIVLKREGSPDGETIDDPRLWNLLNKRANSYEWAWAFRYRVSAQLLLSRKGVFIEVVRGNDGRPSELHLMRPEWVRPVPDPSGNLLVLRYEVTREDGQVDRLAPDQMLWLKAKPHPTDPYQQLTPMVAAGICADTDWLARLFNRTFLANDGRPAVMVGIHGEIDPHDAEELQRKFSGGPLAAGQVSIVSGAEGITIQDMQASPHDIQWSELITGSDDDINLAFGVPKSLMGDASGRTFDNADAERENFWLDTEIGHCNAFTTGLDVLTGDLDDDIVLVCDFSKVDVLMRQEQQRAAKALGEFESGVITIDEYRKATGKKEFNVPGTRTLYLPNGLAITQNPADEGKIKDIPNVAAAAIAAMARTQGMEATARLKAGPQGQPGAMPAGQARPALPPTANQQAQALSPDFITGLLRQNSSRLAAINNKALSLTSGYDDIIDAEIIEEDDTHEHPYKALRLSTEGVLEGLLLGWDTRQEKVVLDRLDHTKVRRFTRHWEGEPGTKALDPDYVVNADQWSDDIKAQIESMIRPVLEKEARKAVRELKRNGVLDMLRRADMTHDGEAGVAELFGDDSPVEPILNNVLNIVEVSARRQSRRIKELIHDMDANGASMTDIKRAVTHEVGTRSSWRRGLAVNLTTSGVEGVKYAVFGDLAGDFMSKQWNTEDDERVRLTHQVLEGRSVSGKSRFTVGGTKLLFPGDPSSDDLSEIINCRCWLEYRSNL